MVTIDPWKTKNGGQLRLSVLRALFDALDIEDMQVAQGALRQGVLYDMVNRESPATDLRSAAVTASTIHTVRATARCSTPNCSPKSISR